MGNVTLMLPEELQKKMKQHSEIRWSEVIRKTIQKNRRPRTVRKTKRSKPL